MGYRFVVDLDAQGSITGFVELDHDPGTKLKMRSTGRLFFARVTVTSEGICSKLFQNSTLAGLVVVNGWIFPVGTLAIIQLDLPSSRILNPARISKSRARDRGWTAKMVLIRLYSDD